ncbi:XkdQ/YqbQ family protein [Clostridium chromiireducens]|uniref:XkdQ/YqbQ family protein n=1 Tax=Clostridium chromiireducens TaxID=225345 RepID=UPI003AF8192F
MEGSQLMIYKLVTKGADILIKSNNISWGTDSQTLGSQLSFDSLHSLSMGQVVSFFIDGYEVFRGTVVKCTENKFSYSYTCFDYSFYLKSEVIKQFNNMDVTSGLSSLFLEFGIEHIIINIPTKINKFYKGDTIESIINDFLDQAGKDQAVNYFREMQGAKVVIDRVDNKYIYPKFLYDKDIKIDYSIENMKNKIQVVSNSEGSSPILAESEDKNSQWYYGLLQKVEKVEDKDISQAKNIADNLLKSLNRVEHSTTVPIIVLDRAETIQANRLIYLNNDKLKAGWYWIKSATHTVTSGVHKASINVGW